MFELPRSPHGDHGIEELLRSEPIGALNHRIRIDLKPDQRRGARRMAGREQHRRRERGVRRDENRFATPEIV